MALLVQHAMLDLGVVSARPMLGVAYLQKESWGAWVSPLGVQLLISAHVTILGYWNEAGVRLPTQHEVCLSPSPSFPPLPK